jgi:putative transposase
VRANFLYNLHDFLIQRLLKMSLSVKPKRHRYPAEVISHCIWSYHRFNDSYRDVAERLAYRGILISHETVRNWCNKFGSMFTEVIKKRERKPTNKWHLDEMNIKVNGIKYILWRAVDSEGQELDIFLQKRKNKKAAIRFLTRLLGSYPAPRDLPLKQVYKIFPMTTYLKSFK